MAVGQTGIGGPGHGSASFQVLAGRLGWTPDTGDQGFCFVPELLEHSCLSFDGLIAVLD